jgi:hypothetical protein
VTEKEMDADDFSDIKVRADVVDEVEVLGGESDVEGGALKGVGTSDVYQQQSGAALHETSYSNDNDGGSGEVIGPDESGQTMVAAPQLDKRAQCKFLSVSPLSLPHSPCHFHFCRFRTSTASPTGWSTSSGSWPSSSSSARCSCSAG